MVSICNLGFPSLVMKLACAATRGCSIVLDYLSRPYNHRSSGGYFLHFHPERLFGFQRPQETHLQVAQPAVRVHAL